MLSPLLLPLILASDLAPGISESLAAERRARISNLRYELTLAVPAKRTDAIEATARLRFDLRNPASALALDFAPAPERILGITANGKPLAWRYANQHIILAKPANDITIHFHVGDGPLNRNDEFLYSLFVPARAHHAIPCFDQPDIKGRFTVNMQVPPGWVAFANQELGTPTEPLPTYLWHFAAGKFQVETETRNGRRIRMFHREPDAAKVARNRKAIFDLHFAALQWMEEYTAIPYPFGKFDFMALPSFQFGGMEHAGAISYNAGGLFLDESATQAQKLGRASVISHETAHMWFGDLVTMRWFNDVWLKEVFANLMAAKMVNPAFPELNHELRFYLAHYRGAYNVDRTAGANAIRQRLGNLNEAGSMYGPIIYLKAPIVMRELETMLGESSFREGLREYLKRYSFRNATWDNLIAILDARTASNLRTWSRKWIDTPGRPKVAGRVANTRTYGEIEFQPQLLESLPGIQDPLDRAVAWSNLWEAFLAGQVTAEALRDLGLRVLATETDELNIQRYLGDLVRLTWLIPGSHAAAESAFFTGMEQAANRSLKSAYFNAYRDVADSPAAMQRLSGIWSREKKIADLPLSENDECRLALELAVRGRDILGAQLERIQNKDRKAQFAFVMPALSGDAGVRRKWFEALRDRANRAREPWVLEGLSYLHHPLRAGASEVFLLPSLRMLEEIQRTGDIFFPQRWMNTTLANHHSLAAAVTVRQFLAGLPAGYPDRLRKTILTAADDLFRLSK
jgi:aminopeptidase N